MVWVWILLALPAVVLLAQLLLWRLRRHRDARQPKRANQAHFDGGGQALDRGIWPVMGSRGREGAAGANDADDGGGDGGGGGGD